MRDTDLSILVSHQAFGRGNVGPALQHVGGHSQRDGRRRSPQRRDGHAEAGSRLAHQHGDGVLILRARLLHQRQLRQRGVEQRGLLRDFQSAGNATVVAVIHQIQPLALIAHGFLHHLHTRHPVHAA